MATGLSDKLRTETDSQFAADWERQRRTAADILQRLQVQEGVILADQVGMGKTYVALAVAVTAILATREPGQVVVFVPAAVADKWVREWNKFSETLMKPKSGIRCVEHPVRSGEDFLKALDDPPDRRNHLVIVTHTALTSSLKDSFIQLALLYYAIKGVRGAADLRKKIAKWSEGRQGIIPDPRFSPEVVDSLLGTPPIKWRGQWQKLKNEELPDDPVPAALEGAAGTLRLSALRNLVETLPTRRSPNITERLKRARQELADATQTAWQVLLASTSIDLPLLIVDEAHRLKNSRTQISRLFSPRSDDPKAGALHGVFRRMLFLTATPFELGHSELINVLSRLKAVGHYAPPKLDERLLALHQVLTNAQINVLSLDAAWGRITPDDLAAFDTWSPESVAPDTLSAAAREAWSHASFTAQSREKMHMALRPWVIRHERPQRRDYLSGAAIVGKGNAGGIEIPEDAALPFLLAARAQSVALDGNGPARPLFAYGIASSYEAFARLGADGEGDGRDSDVPTQAAGDPGVSSPGDPAVDSAVTWYRNETARALKDPAIREAHPKIIATVDKAASLWLQGEKCLIFSWFIRSGKAIEAALAKRIDSIITEAAVNALQDANPDQALERIAERLLRSDSSSYARFREKLTVALREAAGGYNDVVELIVDTGIRHLRTPAYLIRYTSLEPEIDDELLWAGIQGDNPTGIVLLDRWKLFAERLARARRQAGSDEHDSEFSRVRFALTGEQMMDGTTHRGASLHPVRRAHGATKREVRERLITLFNTPFAPELLVASSVMGEGIDLHQECRFVIHHDLDWNPSVLEQRTGRLDRIGALAERVNRNIEVYEPYLAGTHDEKMYKVVKDRAQWFDIVMGRSSSSEEDATDVEAARVPLHPKIRSALTMDLRSPERPCDEACFRSRK